ncbi:MAG: hypothetical protein IPO27_07710 [Bacteroidetes bacterium]|nr:hypothetical protein [Bacteroidota bacterium]
MATKKTAKKAAAKSSKPIASLPGERWSKVAKSDTHYMISNMGRMKSFFYDKENGKIVKGKLVNGYIAVDIVHKGVRKNHYLHNLVAEYFGKKNSPKHIKVVHLDWKKLNNKISNLKYVTLIELYKRNAEYNAKKFGSENSVNAKLNKVKVQSIRKELKGGTTQRALAKKYKVSLMTISRVALGKSWTAVK